MIRRWAIDGSGHNCRIRCHYGSYFLFFLLRLALLWYLHQFALSGAMDHLQNLRLRWINAGLMEERLQSLGFTDDGTAVGYHAAPYLVQLSVKQQQQQQKEENNCSRTSVNDVWNWTEREFTGNTAVGGGETNKKKQKPKQKQWNWKEKMRQRLQTRQVKERRAHEY